MNPSPMLSLEEIRAQFPLHYQVHRRILYINHSVQAVKLKFKGIGHAHDFETRRHEDLSSPMSPLRFKKAAQYFLLRPSDMYV